MEWREIADKAHQVEERTAFWGSVPWAARSPALSGRGWAPEGSPCQFPPSLGSPSPGPPRLRPCPPPLPPPDLCPHRLLLLSLPWLPLSSPPCALEDAFQQHCVPLPTTLSVDPRTPVYKGVGPLGPVLWVSRREWDLAKPRREPSTYLPGGSDSRPVSLFSMCPVKEPLRYGGLAVCVVSSL